MNADENENFIGVYPRPVMFLWLDPIELT